MSDHQPHIDELIKQLDSKAVEKNLEKLNHSFSSGLVFSTSFSQEDQVISHFIFSRQLNIEVFTLDTGRLFPETYSTWTRTLEKYSRKIIAYYPEAHSLQNFVEEKGPNSFYESVENRKECCYLRKVEPLQRALRGKEVWITGIRAEHSPDRHDMKQVEWDEVNKIIKYHPLLYWTTKEVTDFINANTIPYNPLYDKGFVSIGCAPCTRAIQPGEDLRAGRWWWEDSNKKECGLHLHAAAAINTN